jgi:hypothetical protein
VGCSDSATTRALFRFLLRLQHGGRFRGAISCEVQALNLEHGENPEDASTRCLLQRGSELKLDHSIPPRVEPCLSVVGKSAWHGSQDRDNGMSGVPGFGWRPNGTAPDLVMVAMDLRADLKDVTSELGRIRYPAKSFGYIRYRAHLQTPIAPAALCICAPMT